MSFPNDQSNPLGAIPVYTTRDFAQMGIERAGSTITTGGTSQAIDVAFDSRSRFLIIQNPPDAASQGVAAENLFVALDTAAVVNGVNNYAILAPGNCCAIGFTGLIPNTSLTVYVVGATTGHKFLATHFYADE